MSAADNLSRARELFAQGDPDGAAAVLEPLVDEQPENTAARLLLARSYSRMRGGEDAVAELDDVLAREPENVEALTLRGAEHYFADELDEAITTLERAIELDPDAVEARARLAQVLVDSKDYIRAGEILDEADALGETRPEHLPLVRMARVYLAMQRRDHARAVELIEENEPLWTGNPYVAATVKSNHAIIMARKRDFTGARELLIDALDLDPYFHSARGLLGQIAAMQRDHQLAVEQLEQVIDSGVDVGAQVHYALASSLGALGRTDEANAHYRHALEAGLSGAPALTARLSVAIPNLRTRFILGGALLAAIAYAAFNIVPPFMVLALVVMLGLLGYQIIRGGR